MTGPFQAFVALAKRDLLLAFRHRNEIINPILFFIIVISLFPLGVSPKPETLRLIAPAVIWITALLANLLSLESLFRSDFEDGALEQLLITPQPLTILVLAKVFAHWVTSGLALVICAPLGCLWLAVPFNVLPTLVVTLLIATPTLSLIGAIGVALTVGLRRGGALLSLLVLPLYTPVLIFATSALAAAADGFSVRGHVMMLAAFLVLALSLAPLAVSAALRISME